MIGYSTGTLVLVVVAQGALEYSAERLGTWVLTRSQEAAGTKPRALSHEAAPGGRAGLDRGRTFDGFMPFVKLAKKMRWHVPA